MILTDPSSEGRGPSSFRLEKIARVFHSALSGSLFSQGLDLRMSGKSLLPYGMTRHPPVATKNRPKKDGQ